MPISHSVNAPATSVRARVAARAKQIHYWLHEQHPAVRITYKALVGIIGTFIIIVGIILIPLPGPGWLIVFLGLAFLGLEFPIIHRFNTFLKGRFSAFWHKVHKKKERTER